MTPPPLRIYREDGVPPAPPSSEAERDARLIAAVIETIGTREALHRLTFTGPYQAIYDEIIRRGLL